MNVIDQERRLADRLQTFLMVRSPIANAINYVRRNSSRCFVFGGALRDIFRPDSLTPSARDVDIVVSRNDLRYLIEECEKYVLGQNRFGGYRIKIGPVPVDIWAVDETWAFRKTLVLPQSFYSLTKTTFLNIDGIAADVPMGQDIDIKVFAKDYLDAFNSGVLDISLYNNPFPTLVAIKALRAMYRYDLKITHRLASYLYASFRGYGYNWLENEQVRHYGRALFDHRQLEALGIALKEYLCAGAAHRMTFSPRDQLSFHGI